MREYAIAVIPGDSIGPEVIAAGLEVFEVLEPKLRGFRFEVREFPWGSEYMLRTLAARPRLAMLPPPFAT